VLDSGSAASLGQRRQPGSSDSGTIFLGQLGDSGALGHAVTATMTEIHQPFQAFPNVIWAVWLILFRHTFSRQRCYMVGMVRTSPRRMVPNWIHAVSVAGVLAGCAPTAGMSTREGVRQYAPAPSTAPLMGRLAEARGSSMGQTARSSQLAANLPSKPTAATISGEAPPIDNSEHRIKSYFRLDALRVEFLSDWAIFHVSASVGPVEGAEKRDAEAVATIDLWPLDSIPTAFRVKGDDGTWSGAKRLGALAADEWFGKVRVDKQLEQGQVFERPR